MAVKIEDGKLTIVIELQKPTPNASGKTLVGFPSGKEGVRIRT